jgi:GT2 family glycosyltransferase
VGGSGEEVIESVSVVVPTIGRTRLADVVAASLVEAATTEVVVVADRNRGDVDAVLAGRGLDRDARVVVVDGPGRGSASARQCGIERARGDLVVLLDDDVVPESGLVSSHRAAHAGRTATIVAGPMPVAPELDGTRAVARIYANDYAGEWSNFLRDERLILLSLWGGNLSVRRRDALAVPQAGEAGDLIHREDQEWGLRAARAGMTGALAPAAVAVHWHDGTAAALLDSAIIQVRIGRGLARRYPELGPDSDPRSGLPTAARRLVDLAGSPVVGGPLRRATVAVARRLGDGPPTRWRLGLLVIARAMVQRAA